MFLEGARSQTEDLAHEQVVVVAEAQHAESFPRKHSVGGRVYSPPGI